jgi:hypothetical protein
MPAGMKNEFNNRFLRGQDGHSAMLRLGPKNKVFVPTWFHAMPWSTSTKEDQMDQSKISRWVEVSFQRDVVHGVELNNVPIAKLHRHRVTFSVRVNVHHGDREIEYFGLRRFCMELWPGDTHSVGDASLESLAEKLLEELVKKYPYRIWEIRVLEDAENGAVVQYQDAA